MLRKTASVLRCSSFLLIIVGYLAVSLLLVSSSFKSIFLQQRDSVNKHLIRQNCNTSLKIGEMCPPFYTDLGGKCELRGAVFDCPDIRHKANSRMRQAQLVMVRMLRIFHLIAAKHNIRYWLSSGTLLGAARHKGFIPWDHDVDIEMPMQDYVKFFTVGSKDLPNDIFFQNSKTDSNLGMAAKKAAKRNPKKFLTHPKVGAYRNPWNARLRDKGSCYGYCRLYNCKWHDGLMMDLFVTQREIKDVFPLKEMEFEGFIFPVPRNWSEILQKDYGEDVVKMPSKRSARQPQILPYPTTDCKELAGKDVEFD